MSQVQVPARVAFRQLAGLVRFQFKGGQTLTRIHEAGHEPPWPATHWWDGKQWRSDFGGAWFERGTGHLEWRWE